jgi:hypothetical protein
VAHLKDAIKKKNEHAFAASAIDANTLVIWKVGESSLCALMTSNFREVISTHSFGGSRHEA